MRTIPGCQNVTIPFWDDCFDLKTERLIRESLTRAKIELDGKLIDNPLFSYKLKDKIDAAPGTGDRQKESEGYVTGRFPLSDLVGIEKDQEFSRTWNAQVTESEDKAVEILNGNVRTWLRGIIDIPDVPDTAKPLSVSSMSPRFIDSMKPLNYTLFSNTTLAGTWSDVNKESPEKLVVPLESPHNSMHLSIGGFFQKGMYHANHEEYQYASGDMGENETASMDSIFLPVPRLRRLCLPALANEAWCYQKR